MGFSGRPPGLPASGNRSPKPKTGSLGRPGDRSLQHWVDKYKTDSFCVYLQTNREVKGDRTEGTVTIVVSGIHDL